MTAGPRYYVDSTPLEAPNHINHASEAPQEDGIRRKTTLMEAVVGTVTIFGGLFLGLYLVYCAEQGVKPW